MTFGTTKKSLLGASALLLVLSACGGDDEAKAPEQAAEKAAQSVERSADVTQSKSPIEEKFTYADGEPLDMTAFAALMSEDGEAEMFTFADSSFDKSIGAQVFTDVAMAGDGDGTVNIGRMELYGFNTDYVQRLKADQISETKEQLFRKVRLFDVSLTPELTVDGVAAEGEAMPEITIGAMEIDRLSIGGFDPATFEENEMNDEGGKNAAAVMKGVDFGGLFIKDMVMSISDPEGGDMSFNVADMRFGGFADGTIGKMTMRDMGYSMSMDADMRAAVIESDPQMAMFMNGPLGALVMPEQQTATVSEMTWDGMSLAGLLPYLESGEEPPLEATNLLSFGKIEIKDQKVSVNGKPYAETRISTIDPIEFAWLIPTRIAMESKDSKLDMTALVPADQPEMMTLFTENNLDEVTGDGTLLWEYDEKSGAARFVSESDAKNLMGLTMRFAADGLPLEQVYAAMQQGEEGAATALDTATVKELTLRIEDDALLDVGFGLAGMQMGQPGEQLRAAAPMMIGMGGQQLAAMNPRFEGYTQAVSDWIVNGGTIEVSINPEEPVTFKALGETGQVAPQTLPDLLNLTVTHTE